MLRTMPYSGRRPSYGMTAAQVTAAAAAPNTRFGENNPNRKQAEVDRRAIMAARRPEKAKPQLG